MNLPCAVVKDLLPLYRDEVCAGESAALVAAHLERCEGCRALLAKMEKELSPPRREDAVTPLLGLRTAWKKGKRQSFWKGCALAAVCCAALVGLWLGLTQWRVLPVPPELLEVTEVVRLSDGRIAYHLQVTDDKDLHFIKFSMENGSYSMIPTRALLEGKRNGTVGLFNRYFVVDTAAIGADSYHVGGKNGGVLLWEEGMELPQASPEQETAILGSAG